MSGADFAGVRGARVLGDQVHIVQYEAVGLHHLLAHPHTFERKDDIYIHLCALLTSIEQSVLLSKQF